MNKEIKVVSLVSYNFIPPKMGGQKGIALFNKYLSQNLALSCLTIKSNQPTGDEGYPVKNILSNHKSRYFNIFYFFRIRNIILQENFTHLILEHPYYGWLGILLKWFCKIKLIVHSHNIESMRFKSMGKWWWGIMWHYEKFTHRQADLNFFIQDNDRDYALTHFKLKPIKCHTITYGFELNKVPDTTEKTAARKLLCETYGIPSTHTILLFNGTLNYQPNLDALNVILEKINPLLLTNTHFKYKILICGNKLPASYHQLFDYKAQNIIYAGFVDDISLCFKGADIFINPVIDGGGIKTKVVEALGYNLSVISTKSGAIGIPLGLTAKKMMVSEDEDWTTFTNLIYLLNPTEIIPPIFFDHFYWGNITAKAAQLIHEH